jgi:hypothetical protein
MVGALRNINHNSMGTSDSDVKCFATNDSGQCRTHTSVQIMRLNKCGEWKQIMTECPLCSACDSYSPRSNLRLTILQKPLIHNNFTGNERMSRSPTDVNRLQNVSFRKSMIGRDAPEIFPPLPLSTEAKESVNFFPAHLQEEKMARTSSLQQKLLDRREKIRALKRRGLVLPSQRNVGLDVSSRNSATHGERHQLGHLNKFELSYDTLAKEGLSDNQLAFNITKSLHPREKEWVELHDFERKKADLPPTVTQVGSYSLSTSNNSTNHNIQRSDYASNSITRNNILDLQKTINSSTDAFTASSIPPSWSTASISVDSVSILSSESSVSLHEGSASCVSITTSESLAPVHQAINHVNSHPRRISDCSQESKTSFSRCDSQGRCVHHPHIQLKNQKSLLFVNCTECCYEEVVRLRKKNLLERDFMGSDYSDVTVSSSSFSDNSSDNLHLGMQYEFSRRTQQYFWNSLTSMESGSTSSSSFMSSGLNSATSLLTACSPIQSRHPGILRRPSVCGNISKKNHGNRGRVVFAGRDDIIS